MKMLYKATKEFQSLGIENNYQGLTCDDYYALRAGESVELGLVPAKLLEGGYIEKVGGKAPPKNNKLTGETNGD